jgi:hypothetical protein
MRGRLCRLLIAVVLVEIIGVLPAWAASPTIGAAGDISPPPADESTWDHDTANVLRSIAPNAIFALGDLQYYDGAPDKFSDPAGYAGSWGQDDLRERTCPVPGNHEYYTPDALGYRQFFRDAGTCLYPLTRATTSTGDWIVGAYAFKVGAWWVYALNSDCGRTHPSSPNCDRYGPQVSWLRAHMKANPARCRLAFWHAPRWGNGAPWGDDGHVRWLWEVFAYYGGDVVLSAHSHAYERFRDMRADGTVDTTGRGPVQFTVGTGGRSLFTFSRPPRTGTVYRDDQHFGVLKLVLADNNHWYSSFRRTNGVRADGASGACA